MQAPATGSRHFQLQSGTVSEKLLFSAVFEQLEYCYSILSGSARNCGNQLGSSCLRV